MKHEKSNTAAPQYRLIDPAWQAAVPLFSWGGLLSPAFFAILCIGMSISLFISEDLASTNEALRWFSAQIRNSLLSVSKLADIQAHARTTSFPHAALLSHAFLWLALPLLVVLGTLTSIAKWAYHMEWFHINRVEKKKLVYLPMVALFCFGGAAIFTMLPASTSMVNSAELTHRLPFSLLTGTFIFSAQLLGGWLPLVYSSLKN